jgi:hypothetical protein
MTNGYNLFDCLSQILKLACGECKSPLSLGGLVGHCDNDATMGRGVEEGEVGDMCLCCTKCAVPIDLVDRSEGSPKFLDLLRFAPKKHLH